jgi:nitronate monooxygenase
VEEISLDFSNVHLKIGKHESRFPLIQGGMGVGISGPVLAGTVAKEGGVGTIASVGLACDSPHYNGRNYFEANELAVKDALKKAREIAGGGVLAVNCMVALADYDRHVRSACEGGADMIISGSGLPVQLPEFTADFPDVALVPIVSSKKAASIIFRRWEKRYKRLPDAIVVETPLYAGGHLGAATIEKVTDSKLSLDVVVPELVNYLEDEVGIDIPVIAAGGIWDREDVEHAFALGARGVQMGTRFASTFEGDASERFKQAYIDAKEEDVVLINSPAGLPGRAIKNPFITKYLEGSVESKPCIANCLAHCRYRDTRETFCIAQALVDAFNGDWEHGLFFCGSNVTRIEKMEHVADIIHELFD